MYEVPSPIQQVPSPVHSSPLSHVPSPQCQVPSPSQWLDPCRSPPSLHSPPHYPADLDKLKEEPYSPAPQYTTLNSPPKLTSLTPTTMPALTPLPPTPATTPRGDYSPQGIIKKEGYEPSINIADLIAENNLLVSSISNGPQVYYRGDIHHRSPPHHQRELVPEPQSSPELAFLDSLVEVKKEVPEEVVTRPASSRDVLEAVGMLALDHARRDVHLVSQSLRIPLGKYHILLIIYFD